MKAGETLRAMVRAGLWVGAVGSLCFTVYAGRHNASVLLRALFAVWVLSPFAGLLLAERSAERVPTGIANSMRGSALVIMVCSLGIYGAAAMSGPGRHTTFAFLAVPVASWLAIVPLLIASRIVARR
ncbi:hypothetical protein [Occallatibacter riparius]|uniref:Uncharacterized protein n=1 Tax=Occallatibacter riparius TaxID=1002689 RepID=A0A9J7BIF2_9BACT|nr:hypothetical protein [Occallatibacter riparius]UWZ82716.1 hypothetical protein MOP44_19355 [Occallatibacter riparius]